MIADSMICEDTVVYCTGADEIMRMHIVGSGEVFNLDRKCSEFFARDFNWAEEQKKLEKDTT